MNRLDVLPDNGLEDYLSRLETDLAELKAAPQKVGSQSVTYAVYSSSNAYDWSGVLGTDPQTGSPFGYHVLQVNATFTAKGSIFGDLFVKMFVGTSSNWYRPSQYLVDVNAGLVPPWSATVYDYPTDLSDLTTKKWDIVIRGDNTTTVYIKYFIAVGGSS